MKTRISRVFRAVVAAVAVALSAVAAAQAQSTDIAVLWAKVDNIDTTLARMDDKFTKRLDRMDGRFERLEATIVEIKENAARTDEKINALQSQNNFFIIPLLLLLVASMFGLLTKGILWGVAREPQASAGASRPAQIPPQQFRPS